MDDEEQRRDLERRAFGETASDDQRSDALRQLSRLARPREAAPSSPDAGGAARDDSDDSDDSALDHETTGVRKPRRRSLVLAGILVATLFVGGAVGAVLDGAFRPIGRDTLQTSAPVPTTTEDSAATSRLAAGDPAVVVPTVDPGQAADALLSRSATPADKYPFADGDADDYVDSSTRLVVTTVSLNSVWIAHKRGTSGGYCILTATGPAQALGITGATSCASPGDFDVRGLLIATGDIRATWRGATVTVSVTN